MASAETTQEINNEYSDMFIGIGCFKGTFSLQIKDAATHVRCDIHMDAYMLYECLYLGMHVIDI